jgi:peptide/nickel transport system permease protein
MADNQLGETRPRGLVHRILDSDVFYSFSRSPVTIISAVITTIFFITAGFAPWLAPHNPFDPASLDLMDGFTSPAWTSEGTTRFLLGTDDQGRDILSTIMYGSRVSLIVGFSAVIFSVVVGVSLGLLAGYVGGWLETAVMRLADVQLAIPAILVALMIDGIARILLPVDMRDVMAIYVLILAIGISDWPRYARVTRGSALVERNMEYVSAARVIGVHPVVIMFRHVLPNVLGPVLVLATIGLALAIITEATLSFLGVGVPPTTPSLGTLIRVGNNYLFSGEWWITLFPALSLVILVLAVNLLGDWLRDALNPKLR